MSTHIFSAKNIRILYIEWAKTVNEMTLNELVKLTTLWTTGPWYIVWSESLLYFLMFYSTQQLKTDSEGLDQTTRMCRLTWTFSVCICPKKCFHMELPTSYGAMFCWQAISRLIFCFISLIKFSLKSELYMLFKKKNKKKKKNIGRRQLL